MADDNSTPSSAPAGKSLPKWTWIVAVGLLAIVAWQVGRGVFIKSIDAPGGASIDFYAPQTGQDQASALKAQQDEIRKETQQAIDDAQKAAMAKMPPAGATPAGGPNSGNSIDQFDGEDNSASIHGDHNTIQQSGHGNHATIGGN